MENFNLQNPNINVNNANNKANMVSNSQSVLQTSTNQPPIEQYVPRAPQIPTIDYSMLVSEMPKMEQEVILKYLQNLLKLPNTIEKFVETVKTPNNELVKLLVENLIGTKELAEFLNVNSKDAILKVLDTISTSLRSGIKDVGDLKDVLNILNSIQSVSKDLNSNSLKELLLLYIPLSLPMFDKKMDLSGLSDEDIENIKDKTLSILFETVNFSNLLVTLEDSEIGIFVNVFSNSIFPFEKFNRIIKTLSKQTNINVLIEHKQIKTDDKKIKNQNFNIISNDYVSTDALLLSHIIIKSILKIDKDFT